MFYKEFKLRKVFETEETKHNIPFPMIQGDQGEDFSEPDI